eukprot:CAMPEP_0172570062 /NCGR_PEP_ID=MMETSP1067-20121228/126029_1 /TAXON_ID=265564 ORGANISM="Thalassiosira punctigera, Strain Tpunct2005C2" /NCGR_SAMPLE_ID=MMETSP1067 /ASSEMBLY_ACC=CAM_ASM_000444 /LENGTH=46 /DNA_ID= /DNA_START= /DNA_END= /DNA_ORIENTATION=
MSDAGAMFSTSIMMSQSSSVYPTRRAASRRSSVNSAHFKLPLGKLL